MKNPIFFVFTCVFFLLVSCSKNKGESPTPDSNHLKEEKLLDQSYGPDARQKMDVFLPENRTTKSPLVVIVHGGTWIQGDKSDMRFVQEELLKHQIASVSMNYRFASLDHHYEGMMEDLRKALQLVRENSDRWTVRKNQASLLGYSSGGHLALLYAYGFQQPQEIKTVVSIAGPTELRTLSTDPIENALLASVLVGISPLDIHTNPKMNEASPLFHVGKAVPSLLIHGTADKVVPFAQSEKLQLQLQERGVVNKFLTLIGGSHDITENPIQLLKVMSESTLWIKEQGK